MEGTDELSKVIHSVTTLGDIRVPGDMDGNGSCEEGESHTYIQTGPLVLRYELALE